jgi:hypothetical protein
MFVIAGSLKTSRGSGAHAENVLMLEIGLCAEDRAGAGDEHLGAERSEPRDFFGFVLGGGLTRREEA